MNIRRLIRIVLITLSSAIPAYPLIYSQEVPHSIFNTGIYEFIDELANEGLFTVNSAVKPYSRLFISNCLRKAGEKIELLNQRQRKELEFYLMDFGKEINEGKNLRKRKDLFYYKDDLFSLTVNPILGGELFTGRGEKATYWKNGAEARAYIGNWGFYASLRDNHEKPLLGLPGFLTKRSGGHIKDGTDWSEMLGGVTYSWEWGGAALVKDGMQWGNSYNGSNIFGGNNPSFIQVRLHIKPVKWFDFNYFHGWLNSMVIDSARSYWYSNSNGATYRNVYHKKFIAANFLTISPLQDFNISVGNSIIYTDTGFHPVYLVPVFFYKSVDHSLNASIDNMNSQMFIDLSSRLIRNLHVYSTLFIDELSVDRFFRNDEWNYLSYKAGFRLSNIPFDNVTFTSEFTYTYPFAYQHYIPTLTFESNGYNLGHYLKDNSREWYFSLNFKPLRTLDINIFFSDAVRGPDYTLTGAPRVGNPPITEKKWHNTVAGIAGSYQVINDLLFRVSFCNYDQKGEPSWSPELFQGRKNILNLGLSFGF